MTTFNITVLPGDYIGPEITGEARRVLEAFLATDMGTDCRLLSPE